jgi:hypothetical protein
MMAKRSQLVAQIPDYRLLPTGNQNHCSHPPTLIFLAPKLPTNSQAPRASVAPNYQFPKRSQLVAQIPDYRLLPTGNQNH